MTLKPKPTLNQKVIAWRFVVQQIYEAQPYVSSDAAALTAAILTLGSVDLTDPLIAQAVELMTPPYRSTDGNQP